MSNCLQSKYFYEQGIIGFGLNYFLQAWCISRRGPLFNPLCTVIVAILAPLSLHEELYIGR